MLTVVWPNWSLVELNYFETATLGTEVHETDCCKQGGHYVKIAKGCNVAPTNIKKKHY